MRRGYDERITYVYISHIYSAMPTSGATLNYAILYMFDIFGLELDVIYIFYLAQKINLSIQTDLDMFDIFS